MTVGRSPAGPCSTCHPTKPPRHRRDRAGAGEKLYEELLADADDTLPTGVPRLRVAGLNDRPGGVRELLGWAALQSRTPDAEMQARLGGVIRVPAA